MKGRTILVIVAAILVLYWLMPAGLLPLFFISSTLPMIRPIDPAPLAIFMVFAIPLAAIIGGFFIAALKILKSDGGGKGRGGEAAIPAGEVAAIQEMHRGLSRMEKRIDALETILLERPPPIPEKEEFPQ